jgi:glyceraldehyde-3-phosphate dehydrogenase/erythrose-4-phosphate dehydrogenase
VRVPVEDGSLTDLVVELAKPVAAEQGQPGLRRRGFELSEGTAAVQRGPDRVARDHRRPRRPASSTHRSTRRTSTSSKSSAGTTTNGAIPAVCWTWPNWLRRAWNT